MRIHVDKLASVTRNLRLGRTLTLGSEILLEEGSVIACKVRGEKSTYNQLEDPHGRMSTLHDGDILVGALGHRNALQGYEGVMPTSLKPGDTVNLLNMGGVLGQCLSHNPDVGKPFELEVLGQVLVFPEFQSRSGQPAHVRMGALKGTGLAPHCPVVYVAGTCMNAGKTAAACATIRQLSRAGYRVGACKLTGVSLMRDALAMTDGNLTTHIRALQEEGFISVAKSYQNRRPLTTCSLTPAGRKAFAEYITLLEQIVQQNKPQ